MFSPYLRHFIAGCLCCFGWSFAAAQPSTTIEKTTADHHGDALPDGAVARLGTVRLRHVGQVGWLAFTPDGRGLISLGEDTVLQLWEARHGRELARFKKPTSPWFQGSVNMYMQIGGNHRQVVRGPVMNVAASADGRLLAVGQADGNIHLWDAAVDKEPRRFEFKEPTDAAVRRIEYRQEGPPAVAFSPDGKRLAGGGSAKDGTVIVWDLETGKEVQQFRSPPGRFVSRLLFSPDGRMLAGVSSDEVRIWDHASGKRLRVYQGHEEMITALAFSPDSKRLATASTDKTVRFWEASSSEEIGKLTVAGNGFVSVAFSPDGRTVAAGDQDSSIRLWDVAANKETHKLAGHHGAVGAVAFTPDSKTLASGSVDGTIRLWDVATGKERLPTPRHDGIEAVVFHTDGRNVSLMHSDNSVCKVETATGKEISCKAGPTETRMGYGLAPDGKTIAYCTGEDGIVRLWDVEQGKEVLKCEGHGQAVAAVAFTHDGATLASSGVDGTLRLWKRADGKEIRRVNTSVWAGMMAFAPDGRSLALFTTDNQFVVYETATGKERLRFRGNPSGVSCMVFSPDGKLLATGSNDETVRIWDMTTGKLRRGLVGHQGMIQSLAFSPDGKLLASGGDDNAIRLWDTATGVERRQFLGHRGTVKSLAFSPDGKRLLSGSRDTTALIWDVTAAGQVHRQSPDDPMSDKLERLWGKLALDEGTEAYRALCELATLPRETVPFLRERLKPAPAVEPVRLTRLIAELDHDVYDVRQEASRELDRLGDLVAPAVFQAMTGSPSTEAERRLLRLMDGLDAPLSRPDDMRALRAVEVLERIATPDARQVLETLSKGTPGARLTRESKMSLERLSIRLRSSR